MAKTVLTNLDLAKNELQRAVIHLLASDPSSPAEGQVYYNTVAHALKFYNGSTWAAFVAAMVSSFAVDNVTIENIGTSTDPSIRIKALGITNSHISASAAIALSKLATDPLARANHTGTQTASTISDFDTQVRTSRLDQMAAPTAAVGFNSQRITNLATPTGGTDAVTKSYADALKTGLDFKDSVRAATTGNITLSGAQTIDGVSVVAGDRVLVKSQTTGSENGIYVAAAGAWTRATDADDNAEVTGGMFMFVTEGTANAETGWVLATNDPITVGTTSLSFVQFNGSGSISAGAGLTLTGSVLDVGAGTGIQVNADTVQIDPAYTGQTSITTLGTVATGTWNATAISIAKGGTGQTTAAAALAALGGTTKFAASIGDGSTLAIDVTHNLGTKDVTVAVYDNTTPYAEPIVDIEHKTTNIVTIRFNVAPTTNQYRVVVIG